MAEQIDQLARMTPQERKMLNLQANTRRSQKQSTTTSRDIRTINQGLQEFLSN